MRLGFERQRFDKSFDSVLDRAVGDLLFIAANTGAACDADDVAPALRFHLIPNGVRAIEQSADADIDLACPLFRRRRFKRNQRHVNRIMHHDIQPLPAIYDALHQALALGKTGNVGAAGLKLGTISGKVSSAARKFVVANVCYANFRARDAERPGDSPSQAARRPGYKSYAIF